MTMKRFTAIALMSALAFSCAACGGDDADEGDDHPGVEHGDDGIDGGDKDGLDDADAELGEGDEDGE